MTISYGNATLSAQLEPLFPYLDDESIREIAFNQPGEFWVLRGEWERVVEPFFDMAKLQNIAIALSNFDGGKKDNAIMSRVGPRGERIQIMKAPSCLDGTFCMNIRKHVTVSFTIDQLIEQGAFESARFITRQSAVRENVEGVDGITDADIELLKMKADRDFKGFLSAAVKARKNIIVVGATGSGKTTFFRAVMDLVDRDERVVTIEDTHELFLEDFPNKAHLIFGKGELDVTSQQLLEAAMRLSPDRILLGELRGHEAWDYLQSLNTGHPGSITTVHANSAMLGFNRIAMLIKQSPAGADLAFPTILDEVLSSIEIAIFLSDKKIKEIYYDPTYIINKFSNQN
ncbi:P-type DNA transfer ATPase VirB11 [Aeromonas hydrophila]|uniref:P-type DNA transfer ATPase VirB11 n=1 Tax=Aeromonas hydrophila TaxID=644 RepID=UPI0022524996|nr:P-type DNA transfer ATPase VirB11 [Aeromonas hydrophila]MCX4117167.1 P-type DNA transfer ATPase VirB11 [Aeromonas hydrophila]